MNLIMNNINEIIKPLAFFLQNQQMLVYDDLVNATFRKPRLAHQTIREYAIKCVNELENNLKPESVYPFIKKIEDIIYGGIEPTTKELNFAIDLFSNLYNEITGKTVTFSL